MTGTLARLWRVNGGLLVLFAIIGGTGLINFFVIEQRAFLNFYYLPVVFGAYLLGRRKGVYSAVLSCAIVFALAITDDARFGPTDPEAPSRWLDLGTWGCFLILTSHVVGSLYEAKQAQVRELQGAYAGVLEIMARFIDSVDEYTENHSHRVAEYSVRIAQEMRLSEVEIEDIRVGAYLHDVGKVDVSIEVLRKAAGLSPEEYAAMQRHVDSGEALVRSVGGILRHVLPMVAYHHERFDGTGYKGLVGENIPLGARIVAVADTYDAIVTRRVYRVGRSHEEALEIIRQESGRQFDPRVVEAFLVAMAVAPEEAAPREAA